jgi:hypothetical protein
VGANRKRLRPPRTRPGQPKKTSTGRGWPGFARQRYSTILRRRGSAHIRWSFSSRRPTLRRCVSSLVLTGDFADAPPPLRSRFPHAFARLHRLRRCGRRERWREQHAQGLDLQGQRRQRRHRRHRRERRHLGRRPPRRHRRDGLGRRIRDRAAGARHLLPRRLRSGAAPARSVLELRGVHLRGRTLVLPGALGRYLHPPRSQLRFLSMRRGRARHRHRRQLGHGGGRFDVDRLGRGQHQQQRRHGRQHLVGRVFLHFRAQLLAHTV